MLVCILPTSEPLAHASYLQIEKAENSGRYCPRIRTLACLLARYRIQTFHSIRDPLFYSQNLGRPTSNQAQAALPLHRSSPAAAEAVVHTAAPAPALDAVAHHVPAVQDIHLAAVDIRLDPAPALEVVEERRHCSLPRLVAGYRRVCFEGGRGRRVWIAMGRGVVQAVIVGGRGIGLGVADVGRRGVDVAVAGLAGRRRVFWAVVGVDGRLVGRSAGSRIEVGRRIGWVVVGWSRRIGRVGAGWRCWEEDRNLADRSHLVEEEVVVAHSHLAKEDLAGRSLEVEDLADHTLLLGEGLHAADRSRLGMGDAAGHIRLAEAVAHHSRPASAVVVVADHSWFVGESSARLT